MTLRLLGAKLQRDAADWYANLSAATGSAYLAGWTNADVASLSLLAFAAFYLVRLQR